MTPTIEQRNEAVRLWETYERLENAEDAAVFKAYEAYEAYEALDVVLALDDDGKVVRCAITGIPLVTSDETVVVLASALARVAEMEIA